MGYHDDTDRERFQRKLKRKACPQCGSNSYSEEALNDDGHFPSIYYKVCRSCGYERATHHRVPEDKQAKRIE